MSSLASAFHAALLVCALILNGFPNGVQCQSCSPKFLSCPCGKTQDRIVIAVKECDGLTDSDRCSYFKNCTACFTKPVDCYDCMNGKFNGWYRQECSWRIMRNNQRKEECMCFSTYLGNLEQTPISFPNNQESAILCRRPTDPENGHVKSEKSVFEPGETVHYRCNDGYTMVGRPVRKCRNTRKWNGAEPKCVKACIWPLGWRPAEGNSPYVSENTSLTLECNQGFDLFGISHVTCLQGGIWNAEFPSCEPSVLSTNSPALPNTGDSEKHVAPVTKMEELPTMTTTTERLTTTTERLIKQATKEVSESSVTTGPLPTRPGMIQSSSNQPDDNCMEGSIQTYSCIHPFEVDGQSLQQCLPNGKWDAEKPTCKLICGKSADMKVPQIINGSAARINQFPWQVALTSYGSDNEFRQIICGGALISDKWVLTAGHCITEDRTKQLFDVSTLLLLFGKHFSDRNIDNNDVLQRKVTRLYLNPTYDPFSYDSDLGLIRLEEVVPINTMIMPICLPSVNSMSTFHEGSKGIVAGWGHIDNKETFPSVLMMIELPIVTNEKCEASYREHNFKNTVTENMFCAGFDEGGRNTCNGDSGGAMVFAENGHYVLEGIVSWGNKADCAAPGSYGGFVRVRNFMPWISAFVYPSP